MIKFIRFIILSLIFSLFFGCKKEKKGSIIIEEEVVLVKDTIRTDHTEVKDFREFKVTDSKFINQETLWKPFKTELDAFGHSTYDSLKPFILERTIPEIQHSVADGDFTYEELVLFYLYRIRKFDRQNKLSLNAVISLNPKALETARILDSSEERIDANSIFGMPVLLKDNVNTKYMTTTAGAVVFSDNNTNDAFITERLKEKGAIILGKANLSEWAYFFCGDCPSGYSAIGGQTFNPYGRRSIDTGGSSSGSGVAVAANFCVAAVGTETSGSILSPSSQNSVVGLKPTIGLLSRTGIVPISSTLDTPGPMAKSVIDAAILLQSMVGIDEEDPAFKDSPEVKEFYTQGFGSASVKGKRFGVMTTLKEDSLYLEAIDVLKNQGAILVEIVPEAIELPDFIRLLNLDMKKDLPEYISKQGAQNLSVKNVADVITYNMEKDTISTAPYGQKLFNGIEADKGSLEDLKVIRDTLFSRGLQFFERPMQAYRLDAVLSINNYHAGYAAVARYPALTIPMGYTNKNEPEGLTIITTPFNEEQLLEWGYVYEQASKKRKIPRQYQ
ncbi:amidase family protein [Aquimarina sp. ERC-38]|uniref:amidase family protein n=1 Tax=Aquimarina sp. ERC-38 TaxID=2949996 RepID=UPI0022482E39|nr:amidase family protein [Aquimarina sp. ERC-38]UZO79327.1 amidase family protein [Aquimarina sp. ERC-38]